MKVLRGSLAFYFHACVFLLQFLSMSIYGSSQYFSIDRLYPENFYTKACDCCMQVWGALEELIQNKKTNIQQSFHIDTCIGQLAFAKDCVHAIIKDKVSMSYDDIIHLSRIVGTIEELAGQVAQFISKDKVTFFKFMIERLHNKVALLLQTNCPSARTCH